MKASPIYQKLLKIITPFLLMAIIYFFLIPAKSKSINIITEKSPYLFAHRGDTSHAIENTEKAIRSAYTIGFRGVAIDIQSSKDKKFFLFHDLTTQRLLGEKKIASKFKLSELIQFAKKQKKNRIKIEITSADNILKKYHNRLIFYFDMKGHGNQSIDGLSRDIFQLLQKHNAINSVLIASAYIPFITYLEWKYPKIHTVLEGFDPNFTFLYWILPSRLRTDYISCAAYHITPDFVKWLNKYHLMNRFIAYGVNESNFTKLRKLGIKNMIVKNGKYLTYLLQIKKK